MGHHSRSSFCEIIKPVWCCADWNGGVWLAENPVGGWVDSVGHPSYSFSLKSLASQCQRKGGDRRAVRQWLLLFVVVMSSLRALIAVATPPPGYYEVWGDEFNGTSLDPSKWWCWIGPSQSAINTTEAVAVTNGDLIINTYSSDGQNYSGIISSDGLFRARYGYSESSIEFFDTAGEWPAYWIQSPTEGEFIGNPAASGAEMDVCEHRQFDSGNATNINYGGQTSVHWDGY